MCGRRSGECSPDEPQTQFNKRRKPRRYRYDSSLAPELNWDGQNPGREEGGARLAEILDGLRQARDRVEHIAEQAEGAEKPELAQDLRQLADTQLARANAATEGLKTQSAPFPNWDGKAERLSFV